MRASARIPVASCELRPPLLPRARFICGRHARLPAIQGARLGARPRNEVCLPSLTPYRRLIFLTKIFVSRETTYEHLDVRIPPALKYPLHVLLIAHGKACTRCAANGKTSRPSLGPCPLVGLTPGKAMKAKAEPKAEEAEEADDGVEAEAEEGDGEEVGDSLPPAAKAVFDADVDRAIQQAHGGR
jgi:hypothetical protein